MLSKEYKTAVQKCDWGLVKLRLAYLLIVCVGLAMFFSAISCNKSASHLQKSYSKSDSVSVSHETKTDEKKLDSTSEKKINILKKEESEWDNEVIIEYNEPYMPSGDSTREVHVEPSVKKITYKSKGKQSKSDSSSSTESNAKSMIDNHSEIKDDSTKVKKDEKTIDKVKKKSKVPLWQIIIGGFIIVALIIVGYYIYRKYIK